jgi:hypothetical protein
MDQKALSINPIMEIDLWKIELLKPYSKKTLLKSGSKEPNPY